MAVSENIYETIFQVKYTVSKNHMPLMRGDPDICNKQNPDTADAVQKLALLGFPTECPIPEVKKQQRTFKRNLKYHFG